MNIIAQDSAGNQTGIIPIPGKPGIYIEKEDITGSALFVVDDEKYLYLPQNQTYAISLQGYDDGLSTIDLGTMDTNGISTTTEEFADIPTTASTTASFTLPTNGAVPSIPVDIYGDGSTTTMLPTGATSTESTSTKIVEPIHIPNPIPLETNVFAKYAAKAETLIKHLVSEIKALV